MAKLWGAIKGLELAWLRGYNQIVLELDSKFFINKLKKYHLKDPMASTLFFRCGALINRN